MIKPEIKLCDYAVAFIDLLGQRSEMLDRHLPPDQDEAIALVKRSVGKIIGIQNLFHSFYSSFASSSSFYNSLTEHDKNQHPDMAPAELKHQAFSDGFVIYIPLGEGIIKSPVSSIFGMLAASGMLCATGLAAKGPIRAGIDVAWAVEYRPGELYGSALAHAYQLENEVAKWPRVVIGKGMLDYLQYYKCSPGTDMSSQFRSQMASLCLGMIDIDVDDINFLHYLGEGFLKAAPSGLGDEIIKRAKAYIESQLVQWKLRENEALYQRYETLQTYFDRYAR